MTDTRPSIMLPNVLHEELDLGTRDLYRDDPLERRVAFRAYASRSIYPAQAIVSPMASIGADGARRALEALRATDPDAHALLSEQIVLPERALS